MKNQKKPMITIMCDYTATGIWYNGYSVDCDYLIELGIPKDKINPFIDRLEEWQDMYEDFDFYTGEQEFKDIYKTEDFKKWEKMGHEICIDIRAIIPEEYDVEYFDEVTSKRIKVDKKTTIDDLIKGANG